MHGLQPCGALVACGRRLFLQAIPHLRLPSKSSRQTSRRYGVPFLCASRTPLQKLCRRVRRRRSRLPLASNFSLFSCRQQLIKYRLFTTKTSCFFNAFLTHLRDLFLNRAWSLSSALGDREYFVLSSPSLAVSSSMVYFVIGDCRRRHCLFGFST